MEELNRLQLIHDILKPCLMLGGFFLMLLLLLNFWYCWKD